MGVSQIDKIDYIVKNTFGGNTVRFLENKTLPSLLLPKIRRNKSIDLGKRKELKDLIFCQKACAFPNKKKQ